MTLYALSSMSDSPRTRVRGWADWCKMLTSAPHLRCARRGAVGLVLTMPLPPLPCHAVCMDKRSAAAQALLRALTAWLVFNVEMSRYAARARLDCRECMSSRAPAGQGDVDTLLAVARRITVGRSQSARLPPVTVSDFARRFCSKRDAVV